MHRIDTSTAQKDKFGAGKNGFTRGNPQTGTPATDLDDDYFDMLQEELAGVVEATGVSLDKSKHNQLLTALKALLLSREHPFADIKADGAAAVAEALSNLGLGDIATAGTGTGVLSAAGGATLPLIIGGVKQNLIIQWGNITTTAGSGPITFPLAFPTALLASYACEYNSSIWKPGSDAGCAVYGIDTKSRTGMRIASLTYSGGTWSNFNAQCQWLAIGY